LRGLTCAIVAISVAHQVTDSGMYQQLLIFHGLTHCGE
jgi:hypothetical protein